MKTVAICAFKGGVGKTTLCWNIAATLAKTSKVLIIDCDPQGNCSSNLRFNILDENPDIKTVADIFDNFNIDPLEILQPTPLDELPNLDFFPSNIYLHGTEQLLSTKAMREQVLTRYIKKNMDFFDYYDYILFDTAPNLGVINQNACFCSDSILLISDSDVNSINGVREFLSLWETAREYSDKEDNIAGLIINNVERTKMTTKLFKFLNADSIMSKLLLQSAVVHTTRFKECTEQNLPINLLKTKSSQEEISRQKAEKCITDLVAELKERSIF